MKILAAIDLSPVSEKVLQAARLQASQAQAMLHLVHVIEPDPAFVGYEAGPQVVRDQVAHKIRDEQAEVHKLAVELRDKGINTTALVLQGPTIQTILDEAEKLEVDLIVVGSHGHGALYQVLVGSVSEGIIRGAQCPVLVVPAREG